MLTVRKKKLYILLPVHNRKEITRIIIKCLLAQTYQNFHLVLIDDGSTDGTESMVREHIQSLTVIKGKGHWWWAGSLQQGYLWLTKQKVSSSDLVLIINDDTYFENNFLEIGVNLFDKLDRVMILAQCYSNIKNELIDKGISIDWRSFTFNSAGSQAEINCFSTRGLMMKSCDFISTKGFYPNFLPHYLSDYEFTIRAIRQGIRSEVFADFKLWVNEATTGYHEPKLNDFQEIEFWDFLQIYFSQKTPTNPLYLSTFIFLSCPWQWKIQNFFRVWKRSLVVLIKQMMR